MVQISDTNEQEKRVGKEKTTTKAPNTEKLTRQTYYVSPKW